MWGSDPFLNFGFTFFVIVFVIILGTILYSIFSSVKQWQKNENSPRLSVPAVVKTKRTNISRYSHSHDNMHSHYSTSKDYYVTFDFESGDRFELKVYWQKGLWNPNLPGDKIPRL